ncbi:hypothetical protein Rhsp01_57960 [Rhizobium sp. NBRC 114257]|uniref:Uncharacterized protein n=1 Tax=Rhizobium dioscoreae TaxID=2653122 RepID=A0ABQ0ZD43_9HYPH|nr:hypothetical protein RsS93_57530 [Rhizobium dioscoreae]GLU84620.1 hypothetical protein Rhsp01_57960 [Rhizobium sp. NBRC 114257]
MICLAQGQGLVRTATVHSPAQLSRLHAASLAIRIPANGQQPLLRLDCIIFPLCPFRLVALSSALRNPMTLRLTGFLLHLAQCGYSNSELIRRQRLE